METIPQDLAGYQLIVTGVVQEGDVFVYAPDRYKAFAAPSTFGCQIKGNPDIDVYRKMDVPRHEGETNWYAGDVKWINEPNKAKTDDGAKPPLAHLPWKALREVSHVQAYGKDKYGDFHNYRKGMEISRNLSCACRHIADFMDGQDNDEETKRSHLASAATRILFALQNHLEGTASDDRYKK